MALKDLIPFGMSLPHRSTDRIETDVVRAVATRAETLGFRDLWVTDNTLDHVTSFDPVVVLTYAAALTSRIGLGASVPGPAGARSPADGPSVGQSGPSK